MRPGRELAASQLAQVFQSLGLLQLRQVKVGEIGAPPATERRIDQLLLHIESDSAQRHPGAESQGFGGVFSSSGHG